MEGTYQSVNFWDFWVLVSKSTKFLSFLKQKISFSSNFQSSVSWDTTPLYFLAEILYTFKSENFRFDT